MNKALSIWRARLCMTQREAATALGVALNTYQQWESGKSWKTGKPVSAPLVALLAAAALEHGLQPVTEDGAPKQDGDGTPAYPPR
ncbi:helix-turn-helix domain-containing protein [Isoalcanivorax beigongshangi]|uniref:Helix-turn-helix domain-containing protein n=1 Tax=Isoalcanivorax beigongshangi TaxID=3238810 RepID=A0ABV4AK37_9GAMM